MPKILLVEDNEMNRDMLSRRLISREFEVIVAVDGESGIKIAEAEQPDLIIMDMGLPILDGWEATKRLKQNNQTKNIPIIGCSAHAMVGDRERGIEAGCNDYDTKPIEFERLLGKIENLLKKYARQ
jgi:CheY-like chemotaxis protein